MNKKTLVGIDYSITSPGICIFHQNEYKYICIKRKEKLSGREKKEFELLESIDNVTILKKLRPKKSNEYSENEKLKSIDSIDLSSIIIQELKKYDEISEISIEGFSYSSNGSSALDLAGFQYVMRNKIINELNVIPTIYSPSTIKKMAGKGNMKKEELINMWYTNEKEDELLENDKLRNLVIENELDFKAANGSWLKPFEDIVDSYWTLKTLINNIENKS